MAEDEINNLKALVIGGSAGCLEIILNITEELPMTRDMLTVIIVHRKHSGDSILKDLLSARSEMEVCEVEDKMEIKPSTIYIAPSDYHLLFENKQIFSLDSSEKIHFSRPSIDVSFESVAEVFGKNVIAVLLSGANADGTDGIRAIHQNGGKTIVQSPASSDVSYMPQQAINSGAVDHVIDARELPDFIKNLLLG